MNCFVALHHVWFASGGGQFGICRCAVELQPADRQTQGSSSDHDRCHLGVDSSPRLVKMGWPVIVIADFYQCHG